MVKLFTLFLVGLLGLSGCKDDGDITTFILVRHAEKAKDDTEDPLLNAQGVERSERLAAILKNTNVDGIYATKYKRTQHTVRPLAESKNLEIKIYEGFKSEEIESMLAKHRGGTVVVCGHSNNIPWTANLLLGDEVYTDFEEREYGAILVVSVVKKGRSARVTRLEF